MSYIESFGSGFDFNDLKDRLGLSGLKPALRHVENSIGLHGFNGMGKTHGTDALALALYYGGSALLGGMGGAGGASGAGGAGGAGGASGSLSGGLFNFSGTQAAAPISEATVIPASSAGGTAGASAPAAADWTSLQKLGNLGNNQGQQRQQFDPPPIHWQDPYNPMNDPAVQSLQAQQQRRAVADALLARAQEAGYTKIGAF